MDHIVGEVQRDFIPRKVGVLDVLGEHNVAVAIVAHKRSGSGSSSLLVQNWNDC